jgi:hypothetical protein
MPEQQPHGRAYLILLLLLVVFIIALYLLGPTIGGLLNSIDTRLK